MLVKVIPNQNAKIDTSKSYQRLFRFEGLVYSFMHLWLSSYKELDAMEIKVKDEVTFLIPKKTIERTSKEGLELFSNNRKFQEYIKGFEKMIKDLRKSYFKHIKNNKSIEKSGLKDFLGLLSKKFTYHYKTEWFYVDYAYKMSKNNPVLKKNLMENYRIKELSRVETINKVFLGDDAYYNVLIRKLSKQFNIKAKDLLEYDLNEMLGLYENKKVDPPIIEQRRSAAVVMTKNKKIYAIIGNNAAKEINKLRKVLNDKKESKDILKGVCASKGKYIGKVKVILSDPNTYHMLKEEFKRMKKGDILVTETTSPEFMPACMKAGAILANQGGLLSHAAVVSRELGIPAIVGLNNATKILKNGDLVEVDAIKGIVKILKKALIIS